MSKIQVTSKDNNVEQGFGTEVRSEGVSEGLVGQEMQVSLSKDPCCPFCYTMGCCAAIASGESVVLLLVLSTSVLKSSGSMPQQDNSRGTEGDTSLVYGIKVVWSHKGVIDSLSLI